MAIWKRPNREEPDSNPAPQSVPRPAIGVAPSNSAETDGIFCLGESIRLKGELAASSDVEIRGSVEGSVRLEGYGLVVAETAQVVADISARIVRVSGQVVGNVTASEQILIGAGGCVLGDLCAPSIQLEDGSRFTGGINRQVAPAKVSGSLSGGSQARSTRSEIDGAAQQARREGLYDQQRDNKN
jgi:cytoskeletal protein CcmA (bactofilin family)